MPSASRKIPKFTYSGVCRLFFFGYMHSASSKIPKFTHSGVCKLFLYDCMHSVMYVHSVVCRIFSKFTHSGVYRLFSLIVCIQQPAESWSLHTVVYVDFFLWLHAFSSVCTRWCMQNLFFHCMPSASRRIQKFTQSGVCRLFSLVICIQHPLEFRSKLKECYSNRSWEFFLTFCDLWWMSTQSPI